MDGAVPGRSVHPRSVHPFTFFSLSAFLSTRRGPCRSEAPSTAWAAPGDHEPLLGGARWRSMGELRLGRSVTWSFCRWTYRQGTGRGLGFGPKHRPPSDCKPLLLICEIVRFSACGFFCSFTFVLALFKNCRPLKTVVTGQLLLRDERF
jgi:hypothetical protein